MKKRKKQGWGEVVNMKRRGVEGVKKWEGEKRGGSERKGEGQKG